MSQPKSKRSQIIVSDPEPGMSCIIETEKYMLFADNNSNGVEYKFSGFDVDEICEVFYTILDEEDENINSAIFTAVVRHMETRPSITKGNSSNI